MRKRVLTVLLWDIDGTLVATEQLHREKLIATCRKYGVQLENRHFEEWQEFPVPDGAGNWRLLRTRLHGAGDTNIYWWFVAQYPSGVAPSLAEWEAACGDYYRSHASRLAAREAVDRLVAELAGDADTVQGYVTVGKPWQVKLNLAALEPAARAALLFGVDADSVAHAKPDPEAYLRAKQEALARLQSQGISLEAVEVRFVAIEDSPTGVAAALSAGVDCIYWPLELGQSYAEPIPPGARLWHVRSVAELGALIRGLRSNSDPDPLLRSLAAGLRRMP